MNSMYSMSIQEIITLNLATNYVVFQTEVSKCVHGKQVLYFFFWRGALNMVHPVNFSAESFVIQKHLQWSSQCSLHLFHILNIAKSLS